MRPVEIEDLIHFAKQVRETKQAYYAAGNLYSETRKFFDDLRRRYSEETGIALSSHSISDGTLGCDLQ